MNTKEEVNNKSSNYPKNKKDLSNERVNILNSKYYNRFINRGKNYQGVNQMNNLITGIRKTSGIKTTARSAYVNGAGTIETTMFTTSNRQIVSAHLHDIVANAYVQTPVPQVKQTIGIDTLRGREAIVTKDLTNMITTLNNTAEISTYNNMFKVTNNNFVYTQANAFFAGFGEEVKKLEKVSFAYELLKIMTIRDQTIEYAGGLNILYSGNTNTVTRTALNQGNYFPESINAANPNMDFYACTLAMLNEYGEPDGVTLVPIQLSDVYQRVENNSWAMVYMQTPFKDFNEAITLSTDAGNLFKCFSNSTLIEGANTSICFVIVDDDRLVGNVDINIGQAVAVNTVIHNPWDGVALVVTMDDVTGVGGVPYSVLSMYERWCNYFYNEEDIDEVIKIMSLAFHKVPMLQTALFNLAGALVDGTIGLRDADRALRTLLISTNGDLLNAAVYRVSVTDNSIWCDGLFQKMTLDATQMGYLVESTSPRMRIATVRHMLVGYGTTLAVKSMDYIWYQGLIYANKIGVCSDLSRMISSKPSNIELINPLACNITNQVYKDYGFVFKYVLDAIFTKQFNRGTKLTGNWGVITMINSVQFTQQKFDVGGLYNMALFPEALESNFNLDMNINTNFKMIRDQTAGTIGFAKQYNTSKALLEQRDDAEETFEDTNAMYLMYRQAVAITATVSDQSMLAIVQPKTLMRISATATIYRIYNRRCINLVTGWMNIKWITNIDLKFISKQADQEFLIKMFDTEKQFNELQKDESKGSDEMDSVDFLIMIPEKKI